MPPTGRRTSADTLDWYRAGPDDKGIYGMMTQLTITGPYINKTLFEQAGVAVPADDADLGRAGPMPRARSPRRPRRPFPMAMDRSGHRFAGPAISDGRASSSTPTASRPWSTTASAPDGRRVRRLEPGRHDGQGRLGRAGRLAYQDARRSSSTASWSTTSPAAGRSAASRRRSATPSTGRWSAPPCGPGGCTGMPGGAGARRLQGRPSTRRRSPRSSTSSPARDVHAELIARTKNVPAHKGLAEKGVDYPDTAAGRGGAEDLGASRSPKISPVAYQLQGYRLNRAIFNIDRPARHPGDRRRDDHRRGAGADRRRHRRGGQLQRSSRDGPGAARPRPALGCWRRSAAARARAAQPARAADARWRSGMLGAAAHRLAVPGAEPGHLRPVHLPADHPQLRLRDHRRRAASCPASGPLSGPRTSRRCSPAGTISTRRPASKDLFWRAVFNTALFVLLQVG